MEKYITSIKDLVYNTITNRIAEDDDSMSSFQMGMVHLLGINTPVDFKRASLYFGNSSLKNDPDANCILGFVNECEGNYSSAFKHYALAAEELGEKQEPSYLLKVKKGRDCLFKSLQKYNLPLTTNDQISKILNNCNKGNAKLKTDTKVIAAYLCEDKSTCLEAALGLFDVGDYYSSKIFLQKGNIDSKNDLYNKIDKIVFELRNSIKSAKGTLVELEGKSILPDYEESLSIANIKQEFEDCSKRCCQEWASENKTIIDKLVKSQKRKISKEKAKKREQYEAVGWWIVLPVIIFGIGCMLGNHWDFNAFWVGVGCAVFYYCVAIYVKLS